METCNGCGQVHDAREPHVYDYVCEVDDDLTCHICLQPFVAPVDLQCGHTFCSCCLSSYARVQQKCPIDRQPIGAALWSPSSIVLRKWVARSDNCHNHELFLKDSLYIIKVYSERSIRNSHFSTSPLTASLTKSFHVKFTLFWYRDSILNSVWSNIRFWISECEFESMSRVLRVRRKLILFGYCSIFFA